MFIVLPAFVSLEKKIATKYLTMLVYQTHVHKPPAGWPLGCPPHCVFTVWSPIYLIIWQLLLAARSRLLLESYVTAQWRARSLLRTAS